jgi:UDP-glucose/GDP-mannose dehydrogenase family, central domain
MERGEIKRASTLVVGLGEVGSALARVLERRGPILRLDIEPRDLNDAIDVMHICIPFREGEQFERTVCEYIERFRPTLTIINSTVVPGTTRAIASATGARVVYSPVRGKHVKMQEDMLRYAKFVAGMDEDAVVQAEGHFQAAGLHTRRMRRVETLELAKLSETTYFAVLIGFAQQVNRYAERVDADYSEVTDFFEEIDFLPRRRYFPGFIGGHCLIPNIKLLLKVANSSLLNAILESNDRRAQELAAGHGAIDELKPRNWVGTTSPTCWLVGDPGGVTARIMHQFATLRGLDVRRCDAIDDLPTSRNMFGALVAIDLGLFSRLTPATRERLQRLVSRGATLYVRGLPAGELADLRPFVDRPIPVTRAQPAVRYRFAINPLIPAALAGEESRADLNFAPVADLGTDAKPLIISQTADGSEGTPLFAIRYEGGWAIFDLQGPTADCESSIVLRLADAASRVANVGALIAANVAAGVDPAKASSVNFTIDDRPANFDYLNTVPLRAFFEHVTDRYSGAHVDFGWTPAHSHASRSYVEVLKEHRAGFVWHGVREHVDHTQIRDTASELADGKKMVAAIELRFGVRFQPVMVFPFGRFKEEHFPILARGGFTAAVKKPIPNLLPSYLDLSVPARRVRELLIIHRYRAASLDRNRMLAMGALGLPILVFVHPDGVNLTRLTGLLGLNRKATELDAVLDFAAEKRLSCRSLEAIAADYETDSAGWPA